MCNTYKNVLTSLVSGLIAVTDWELGHMVQQQPPVNQNHNQQSFKYNAAACLLNRAVEKI